MKNDENIIVLIFGRKFTGKTTLIKTLITKIRHKKTVLIIDKLNKFDKQADHTFFRSDDLIDYLRHPESEDKTVRLNSTDPEAIQTAIYGAYLRGNVSIFMDESDCTFGRVMSNEMRDVILRGRNQGIDLVLSGLRPHRINVDVRNQADRLYVFRIVAHNSLKSIQDEFGDEKLYELVRTLQGPHDFILFDINTGESKVYKHERLQRSPAKTKQIKRKAG